MWRKSRDLPSKKFKKEFLAFYLTWTRAWLLKCSCLMLLCVRYSKHFSLILIELSPLNSNLINVLGKFLSKLMLFLLSKYQRLKTLMFIGKVNSLMYFWLAYRSIASSVICLKSWNLNRFFSFQLNLLQSSSFLRLSKANLFGSSIIEF